MSDDVAGRLPDLVIIGAPKCATTSVARWLGACDDVFMPEEKEVRFLDVRWDKGPTWYEQRFEGARSDQLCMEATPGYFVHEQAPERAGQLGLDRFVAILRDPIERAWSHHWFRQAHGPGLSHIARPFEEIVREELAAGVPENGILSPSRYAHHLSRWRRANPEATLLVVDYGQVADDPTVAFHRVRDFAGLPWIDPPTEVGSSHNVGIRVRWPRLRAVFFRYRLWRRLPGTLGARLDSLNHDARPALSISRDLREELEAFFAPDTALLRELTAEAPRVNDT